MPDSDKESTRMGFLASTGDNTGTSVTNVGHVFGRLGEGNLSYPGVAMPFQWGAVTEADRPGLMISFFGYTEGSGGLDSPAKEIVMEGKAYAWTTVDTFSPPAQPAAAVNPVDGSSKLVASFVALIAVASSLY